MKAQYILNVFSRMKFRTRLNVSFSVLILFIIASIMLMLHFIIGAGYREHQGRMLESYGQQIGLNIDNRIRYFVAYLRHLSTDETLLSAMERYHFQQVNVVLYNATFEFMTLHRGNVRDIRIHRNLVHQEIDVLCNIDEIFNSFSPGNPAHRQNYNITATYLNDRNEIVFSIFKRIYQTNLEREYFLEMRIYETELFGFFNEDSSGNQIYILNDGYLMSMNNRSKFRALLRESRIKSTGFVDYDDLFAANAVWISSGNSSFNVVIETYPGFMDQSYRMMLVRLLPMIVVVLIISFSFTALISARFNNRFRILKEKIAAVSNRELNSDLRVGGADEFGMLADELDETRKRILDMISQNNQINELMRVAEMSALRAQINSHFLFNSLSSVKWLSKQNNKEVLADAVDQLAVFLRYSLALDENQVPLRKELNHLEAYIYLQKLRYGNELHIHTDVDDEFLDCKCVKLVLQPLVENSIFHGKGYAAINITLYSYADENSYYLVVEDDGLGMSQEVIDKISNRSEGSLPQQGYGLRNVIDRVRMCSGGRDNVTIESWEGAGTKIIIRQSLEK